MVAKSMMRISPNLLICSDLMNKDDEIILKLLALVYLLKLSKRYSISFARLGRFKFLSFLYN